MNLSEKRMWLAAAIIAVLVGVSFGRIDDMNRDQDPKSSPSGDSRGGGGGSSEPGRSNDPGSSVGESEPAPQPGSEPARDPASGAKRALDFAELKADMIKNASDERLESDKSRKELAREIAEKWPFEVGPHGTKDIDILLDLEAEDRRRDAEKKQSTVRGPASVAEDLVVATNDDVRIGNEDRPVREPQPGTRPSAPRDTEPREQPERKVAVPFPTNTEDLTFPDDEKKIILSGLVDKHIAKRGAPPALKLVNVGDIELVCIFDSERDLDAPPSQYTLAPGVDKGSDIAKGVIAALDGHKLVDKGDSAGATAKYHEAYNLGFVFALNYQAYLLQVGLGKKRNAIAALKGYESAAKLGDAEGQWRAAALRGRLQRHTANP